MTLSKALCTSSAAALQSFVVANGARISLRQVGAGDRAGLTALFARLSTESRHQRFLSPKRELTARELTFFTNIDHLNHEAIAAVNERDDSIVGVARYVRDEPGWGPAELAIEVADAFQRMGVGTALTSLTIHHAHANGLTSLTATTLWENRAARRLLRNHGFRARRSRGGEIEHELKLGEPSLREAVCVPENPAPDRAGSERPLWITDGGTTNSRITASDSPTANASPHQSIKKEPPCPHTSTADSCARSSPRCASERTRGTRQMCCVYVSRGPTSDGRSTALPAPWSR